MMGVIWVVILVALAGSQSGGGLPLRSTPEAYPHGPNAPSLEVWSNSGVYALPALVLVLTAVGLLFGCTWCFRHKDCKLFTASVLHNARPHPPEPPSPPSEPANNNISEDNNNGPISLREMQNIANNNATAYIVSENEERNRISRESVVEFEPLPAAIGVVDPLERCADWFAGEDLPRNRLQYLREISRGWFGRVVEGEIENAGTTSCVAVKILNQNASLEDKARFLEEAKMYRDVGHESVLSFVAKCLQEDPWIVMFELCSMDLRQYLSANRPKMAILNERGVPLQLMSDVTAGLAHLHSRGYCLVDMPISCDNVLVRNAMDAPRAVLGAYVHVRAPHEFMPPETRRQPPLHTTSSDVWSLGTLIWEVCAWGGLAPAQRPPPPDLPCPYRNHLYQVMQLCWNPEVEARPTAAQVRALLDHLLTTHAHTSHDTPNLFEERWQRLKPNSIPKIDEHVAIVHAPSTSMASHFTGSDQEIDLPTDTISLGIDTAVSRSSSIMSDKDPLSIQIKSESLTNLHGSLEDVRNIYLTHNETAMLECHQGNIAFEEKDNSDSSVDPWLKDIIAGSQDDVSYYKDVSDVIKNLDNILNSEKTSSSESSHQASPSRDNLSLDCKKVYPVQSSMVKSPGISNFQNLLQMSLDDTKDEICDDDDVDRETVGTLSHSFERHSDTTSQHTLENLTPDTPLKDFEIAAKIEDTETVNEHVQNNVADDKQLDLPKENVEDFSDSALKLKEPCVAKSSLSEKQLDVRKDCAMQCASFKMDIATESEVETKSVDNELSPEKMLNDKIIPELLDEKNLIVDRVLIEVLNKKNNENQLDVNLPEIPVTEEIIDTQNHVERANCISEMKQDTYVDIFLPNEHKNSENKDKQILSELISDGVHESSNFIINEIDTEGKCATEELDTLMDKAILEEDVKNTMQESNKQEKYDMKVINEMAHEIVSQIEENLAKKFEAMQSVQNENEKVIQNTECVTSETEKSNEENLPAQTLPPEIVQRVEEVKSLKSEEHNTNLEKSCIVAEEIGVLRSDTVVEQNTTDSTVYMDLINDTNNKVVKDNTIDGNFEDKLLSPVDNITNESTCLASNDSTVYLDLPSILKATDDFLRFEKSASSKSDMKPNICSSTPKGSESSNENSLEITKKNDLSTTRVPDCDPGLSRTKLDQRHVLDSVSPLESPSKSHHTDTYDENSSVVLGPFENCTMELFKTVKSEEVELPKEEILAFSSNFSDINLETPSPLRDRNFLNEVPDIVLDEFRYDEATIGELNQCKNDATTDNTDETDPSGTTKHASPSTPPNSPGIFLASTSQQKYLVDIDYDQPETLPYPPIDSDSGLSSLQKEIDMNQIELTTKLAMAENENNLNMEYSGPLTVEGIVSDDDAILRESEATPEEFLAGNGGSVEDLRDGVALNEECMKALRNELELKLPLAQVASIEPTCETEEEWVELPPPELVVSYCGGGAGGALSPIAEETRHQLSAYENDAWYTFTRTDSSESYLEPCNNSSDEVTDLPTATATAAPSTHTVHSIQCDTYTVQKDVPSSQEMTMSADSLNGSPYKNPTSTQSPINDLTYNKDDDKLSNCERISQVSPFIMSPTTDTSLPVDSDANNGTGVSTLSKTTVPTDAKLSKPTDGLSKATSIDSWCSNDTLYNVEENFDDLALDADAPLEFDEKHDKSETNTLIHHDEDKELSHCSTYIIHDDSNSDRGESFSPDSITANDNDNYTYTKAKTEAAEANTEINDSTKNTQTKDLPYGTLPSYSNCTTEVVSMDDAWKLMQPELVRRSPLNEVSMTPPRHTDDTDKMVQQEDSPHICNESASIKKMDSVEITCLQDDVIESQNKTESSEGQGILLDLDDSSKYNYCKNMAPSVTSTPVTELIEENNETDPMSTIPDILVGPEFQISNISNFTYFQQSAEIRPQDISPNTNTVLASTNSDLLLEADSKSFSINNDRTPTYSDFENSALVKPQQVSSNDSSSQMVESGISSDFGQFESSIRSRPQDLGSMIDASAMLLNSERNSSETPLSFSNISNFDFGQNSQIENRIDYSENATLDVRSSSDMNLKKSHEIDSSNEIPNFYTTDLDLEDETEQPHSIIITDISIDIPVNLSKTKETQNSKLITDSNKIQNETPNMTYDSHGEYSIQGINHTYNSHSNTNRIENNHTELSHASGNEEPKINGHSVEDANEEPMYSKTEITEFKSPKIEAIEELVDNFQVKTNIVIVNHARDIPNGSVSENLAKKPDTDVKCNGTSEHFATVNFINENFEELIESNVDVDDDNKDVKAAGDQTFAQEAENTNKIVTETLEETESNLTTEEQPQNDKEIKDNVNVNGIVDGKVASATEDFLQNEKKYCEVNAFIPLLSDIRFTGPADEIMSTSFTQESPTEPSPPVREQDSKTNAVADLLKEWDSDTESESSNSSSGEFIWKQRDGAPPDGGGGGGGGADDGPHSAASGSDGPGSGSDGSGSEGDEVEFVPSSWDCRAAPAKSSMRSLEQATQDNKKRVVFKRQKYHCVYEYPRETADAGADSHSHSPAYLPDFSTYCDWDPTSAEEAELGYGQLYGSPLDLYPLRAGIAFGADFDEDFFISSSARPFETLGIMSTASQFFPGMHMKPLLERDTDDVTDEFPPPPSPLATTPTPAPVTALQQTRTPSLDFTTPDSGVEDITPGSTTTEEDFKTKKLPDSEVTINPCWKTADSASSSESVSPSSPGGEALGGLRHTRDKLKLDLPPSPHIPSPRHNRVFNFVLDKPKRNRIPEERPPEADATPLVMTDETPVVASALPLQRDNDDVTVPEPTFSTFGKNTQNTFGKSNENLDQEQKIILTDEVEESPAVKEASPVKETVKGEGTVLDSGDEDSGIESSSKASLERNKTSNVS